MGLPQRATRSPERRPVGRPLGRPPRTPREHRFAALLGVVRSLAVRHQMAVDPEAVLKAIRDGDWGEWR